MLANASAAVAIALVQSQHFEQRLVVLQCSEICCKLGPHCVGHHIEITSEKWFQGLHLVDPIYLDSWISISFASEQVPLHQLPKCQLQTKSIS